MASNGSSSSAMTPSSSNKFSITITHFINPHMFWFKYESDVSGCLPLLGLESVLQTFAKSCAGTATYGDGYAPVLGETVLLQHLAWNKWVRAVVDELLQFRDGTEYTVWLVDYGLPLRTKAKWMLPLSEELINVNLPLVHKAGLAHIIPASKLLNLATSKMEMNKTNDWSEFAVKTMEKLLMDKAYITFEPEFKIGQHHYFGNIEAKTYAGKSIDLRNELLNNDCGYLTASTKAFSMILKAGRTSSYERCASAVRQSSFAAKKNETTNNVIINTVTEPSVALPRTDNDDVITMKISEWQERNDRDIESSKLQPRHDIDCPQVVIGASPSPPPPPRSHTPLMHFKPGDDDEPNLMGYAGSKERHRTCVHENTGNNKTNDNMVANMLRRLRLREDSTNDGVPVAAKPQITCVPAGYPIDQLHTIGRISQNRQSTVTTKPTNVNRSPHADSGDDCHPSKPSLKRYSINMTSPNGEQKDDNLSSSGQQSPVSGSSSERCKSKTSRGTKPKLISIAASDATRQSHLSTVRNHFTKQSNRISQMDEQCLSNSQNLYRVLVHARHKIAEPISQMSELNFSDCVHKGMNDMRFRNVYRTQSVAWPNILRGASMVLVNSAASGKTMSYLPAICSLVQQTCDENMVPDGVGPVAVILCVSSVKVAEVTEWCMAAFKINVVSAIGERQNKTNATLLMNGCEILVCTVPSLYRLLKLQLHLFDKRRLKHLIIDDIDLIVGHFKMELQFVIDSLCPREAVTGETNVQLIVTARLWCHAWLRFFSLAMNPILCIGAFIEAAVYAQSQLQLKLLAGTKKNEQVLAALQERPFMEQRTIIVCNRREEVLGLVERLKEHSIMPEYCHELSTSAEISTAKSWNYTMPYSLLVCTDETLVEIDIKQAQNIIHYSLPPDWTKFSFRFSAMLDYFENFVVTKASNRVPAYSLVLLDEENNQQLPRLIEFMVQHNVTDISPKIRNLAEKIRNEIEDERRIKMVPFCHNLLLLGECVNVACTHRHRLTYSDRSADTLPRHGRIKISIRECHTPTHYSATILEHLPPNENKWKRLSSGSINSMKFQNYYAVAGNHRAHIPVQMGDICVLPPQSHHDMAYHRCQVTRVDTKSKKVELRLLDVGTSVRSDTDDLLELAAAFVDWAPQAIDIRIANLTPYDYDTKWDRMSLKHVKSWIEKENHCTSIEGTIMWADCLNTIWVDTLLFKEKLNTMSVNVLSLHKNLVEKKLANNDKQCLVTLKQMAASCGIHDEPAPTVPAKKVIIECSQEVVTSHTPTVAVFQNDSNRGSRIPRKLRTNDDTTTPMSSSSSSKGSISSSLNTSKSVSDKIEPVDRWVQLQPNKFQSVFISTFITPSQFYVQIRTPELYTLYDSIDEFTKHTSNKRLVLEDDTIGMMCLCKMDQNYNRAKVMAIEGDPEVGAMATVFFVDLGHRDVMPFSELLAIPKYLVDMEPFQAVKCSLIGIRPNNNSDNWNHDLCDRMNIDMFNVDLNLSIRPIRQGRSCHDLNLHTYDCVLMDEDDCDPKSRIINDRLVSCGMAAYHPDDRYLLDVDCDQVKVAPRRSSSLDSDDDSYESKECWDDDNYQRPERVDTTAETSAANIMEMYSAPDGTELEYEINFTPDEINQLLLSQGLRPHFNTSDSRIEPAASAIADIETIDSDTGESKKPIALIGQSEELDNNSTTSISSECSSPSAHWYRNIPMPALIRQAIEPKVRWQECNAFITLIIEAPDVEDYCLEVTNRNLFYCCVIGGVRQSLHLALQGCVDTEYTFHEVRGLFVYVRLTKTLRGPQRMWTRLDRHRKFIYNPDAIALKLNEANRKNEQRPLKYAVRPKLVDSDDSDYAANMELRYDYDIADPLSTEFD